MKVVCRSKRAVDCQDGQECLDIYEEDNMLDDGTYDGESVVCDACYVAGGQPALYRGDNPTRQEIVDHVNREMGL